MNHDDLVDHCLGKPGATPDEPWEGDLVKPEIQAAAVGPIGGVRC